jgi:uncharacterized membrane protein YbhN (UPF0104 family)
MTAAPRSVWQRWGWLVRWLGTAGGIAYIATLIDLDEVKGAFARLSAGALVIAILLVAANVVAGALRWRVLLTAYGAESRARRGRSIQLDMVWLVLKK